MVNSNINEKIVEKLYSLQDKKFGEFNAKLVNNIDNESIIGVRTPDLRKYAKELYKREDIDLFLSDLPHKYFEENQLHAFIISEEKDFHRCIEEVESFLPYINNWATCDQLCPKIFKKNNLELLKYIMNWIESDMTYTVRFGIKCLMSYFLDDDFDVKYPELVSKIQSEEYYVKMMAAWYFATALAKQYEKIIPFIEERKLEVWTHNKAIQKAVESYRITDEQKIYLKSLKIK